MSSKISSRNPGIRRNSGKLRILGIRRGERFSPNRASSDAAIIEAVAERLRRAGAEVRLADEGSFVREGLQAPCIFSMGREQATLERLKQLEREGCSVINRPEGIDCCVRRPMTEGLLRAGIPHPESLIFDLDGATAEVRIPASMFPCWLKRGDSHAIVKADVSFVRSEAEAAAVVADFRSRSVRSLVACRHLEGDLLKFYGVEGTDFFYWYYPSPTNKSKFGLEAINGAARGICFSESRLHAMADEAAKGLGVAVYGGDAVVAPDGSIRIIDFNDWPSFGCCCKEAAAAIAALILRRAEEAQSRA